MEKLILKRSSLSDEIMSYLQEQILNGKLKPGQILPSEKEMCDLFSVGRSTVREAIKALVTVGLLEKKRDGTYVKEQFDFVFRSPVDTKLILKQVNRHDLLEARRILEVQLAGLCAKRATPEEIVLIGEIVQQMEQKISAENFDEYIIDDVNFHLTIARAAHNTVLTRQAMTIRELMIDFQAGLIDMPVIPKCHHYHCQIYEAICKKDADKAQEHMLAHLEDVESILEEMSNNKP